MCVKAVEGCRCQHPRKLQEEADGNWEGGGSYVRLQDQERLCRWGSWAETHIAGRSHKAGPAGRMFLKS